MRAIVRESGNVRVSDLPDPEIKEPTDAVVRVVLAAVCGTDLWGYRSGEAILPGPRAGHEFLGVIEDIGKDVAGLRRGDVVLAPFWYSDGTCDACQDGLSTSCRSGGMWGGENDGGQGEAVRVPFADANLTRLPLTVGDERLPALLTLTDVMATGTHGVRAAAVRQGSTVAVVGDGAVGLCAVLAARRAGAEQIILLGSHQSRLSVGAGFGATSIVSERGAEAGARVRELTNGRGAHCVVECVGVQSSIDTALDVVRDGGSIAMIGAPHFTINDVSPIFLRNLTLSGGLTPVREVAPTLLADVLSGDLDPSPVFDMTVDLDGIPDAYQAMADRTAIKALARL
ncbi:zinc-binding dehydrogenase [Saccharopolyspora phatthalungensis]|uniref:Enoyl reductase (ER) domain-containing protein n=1 Tax=Saccharopolyspora phatthalungensis TaxID=664693 RepID=A0A840QKG4_9PSEU|nr:alcohol dehydrogenase catalytic domain-containing protein [Saccharopolyspora phatthalungensis]MBB5159999.1 hypothetical protein [Saccharopolyspora phatthalungensis]